MNALDAQPCCHGVTTEFNQQSWMTGGYSVKNITDIKAVNTRAEPYFPPELSEPSAKQ